MASISLKILSKIVNPLREKLWLYTPSSNLVKDYIEEMKCTRVDTDKFHEAMKYIDEDIGEFTKRKIWKKYHCRRISYFYYFYEGTPIEIDVGCPSFAGWRPHWIVVDGNHRLASAILRGDEYIDVNVSGELAYAAELFQCKIEDLYINE